VDRDNQFSKIVQGIINLDPSVFEPRARLRVVGDTGYVDLDIAADVFAGDFDRAVEDMYSLWKQELMETIAVLAPQQTSSEFNIVLSSDDLRMLLGQEVN
tara:strand:+ start:189922 stop:190221 length:300 start_codon:yes stop_codon:yes gene_type:complete